MNAKTPPFQPMMDHQVEQSDIVHVRRRQGRSIETRANILAAATGEFADLGFNGATTRSIAERAGVRHALVIYHFETKLGVWQAVMRNVLSWFHTAFNAQIEAFRDDMDAVTRLEALQAAFIRMAAAHPELHWLMSHEAGAGGDRLDWLLDNLVGANFTLFQDLIVEAQQLGRYVAGDALHLHYIFLGAAARIFMLSSEVEKVTGRSPFEDEFVEEHIRLCRSLFFRDPPAKPKRKRVAVAKN